jgi:hypothetical protein
MKVPASRGNGGVKALEMPWLHDAVVRVGKRENAVGIFETGCKRFFDQQIDARFEERLSGRGMVDSRNGHRGGVERACGGERCFDGGKTAKIEALNGFGEGGRVGIDNCCKLDRVAGLFELAVDAEMIAAKRSSSDNDDAQSL